ncbi:MAG: hypothetical protein GY801_15095 [bacterium]|nr:hypothetical protein [bacterium]
MVESEALEYIKSLNARRRRKRATSWGLILFGGLVYLDAGWRFPIWLTGIWAFALGTPLIVLGLIGLIGSYKLPVRETLLLAGFQEGKLTAPSLSLGLDISLETSEQILEHLANRGYAQISNEDIEEGNVVYKINSLKKL